MTERPTLHPPRDGYPEPPPRPAWPWVLGILALLVVVGIGALMALSAVQRPRGPSLPPPPATAPPDTGLPVPAVDAQLPGRPQDQLAGWAEPIADATGIPPTALEAYGYAAEITAAARPACGISWTVLAGIGAVESNHGRFDGSSLEPDGRPDPPIRGIPLDGRPGVREIPDTDGGGLDGDDVFDRAVGPLQFIPSTWEIRGVDGDNDGVASPDDIDDAALAAAGYLCASAPDLISAEGWWQAVLAYNRSASYGQQVLDRADNYGRLSRPG